MRHFGRLLLIGAAVVGGAIAAALLWPRSVPVDVATVHRGHFELTVEEDGTTRVRERYVVSAPVVGTLLRVDRHPGEEVSRGELLLSIVPSAPTLLDARSRQELGERVGAAEARTKRASAVLEQTRIALAQDQVELARARKISTEGGLSRNAIERAQLAVDLRIKELAAAEFEHHLAEHELEMARTALLRLRDPRRESGAGGEPWEIRSPVRGRVLRVLQESEAVVSAGAPLLELADPDDMEVVVDLLTVDAIRVAPGARVSIERWGGDAPLEGRVRVVEPSGFTKLSALGVEEQRVNVLVDIVSPPERWRSLGDGFRVDAQITVEERDDALVAPSGALFRDGEGWATYVVESGRARRRAVAVSARGERESVIDRGLAEGTQVVVYPSDAIADGVRVRPRSGT
jgi:HlyD family secretion protein